MIFDFLMATFTLLTPVMIYFMSEYLVGDNKSVGRGFMFLGIVVAVRFFRSFFEAHCGYQFVTLGADVGNSMALGMVNKSLNFSVLCNKKFKMGELANLLQVDCFKLAQYPKHLSSVIFLIYQIALGLVFMGILVHASFLSAFAVIIVVGLFNIVITKYVAGYQKNLSLGTDGRMKMTNEVFNNIKFIKVNAWEEYFYDKLEVRRSEELKWVKKKYLAESLSTFSMWLAPKMILAAIFATFVLTGGKLTAPIAFTVMSLFSYLQFYLQFLPNSLSVVAEGSNAILRIQKFLMAE